MKYLLLGLVMLAVATTAVANNDRDAVNQTLNALHHNASIADFEQYFGLYHDSAIFIGTDASEVWTKKAFKAYAKPHFDKGRGWTYHPRDRPSITTTQASVLLTPTFTKRQTGQSSKYAITAATNTGIISPPHNSNTAVVKRIKISNIAASGSENLRRYQRPKTLII